MNRRTGPHDDILVSRRELVQMGGLSLAGLSLPRLLAAESASTGAGTSGVTSGVRKPAKSCILFFMEGGPSHIDLWDMKPDAPTEIRGEFKPISTSVVGVQVCEHLPMLAKQMHLLAQVRSVHHKIVDHNAGAYYTLTGRSPLKGSQLILGPHPDNFPPFGAVLAKLRPTDDVLPPFVHVPEIMANNGSDLPGQRAGFLGNGFNPFVTGDPSVRNYEVAELRLREELTSSRLARRFRLLDGFGRPGAVPKKQADVLRAYQDRARDLLTSAEARRAFELERESPTTRERYGMPDRYDRVLARKFGGMPHMGQSMLITRRLIEAGVRLVTLGSGRRLCQAWDTHGQHAFALLKRSLLPYADRAFSALLEDLDQRGMLEETLVVAMGEFGRTPRLGEITSSAGAAKNGRDHWPHCYTVFFAGGGIRGGTIYGASDKHGAYPADKPVTPEDIAATIYHAMGVDPETLVRDRFGRPHPVATGKPILDLFG